MCVALAKTTEKHFHYHLDGLDAHTQRELMQLDPSHKGFFANLKCFFKNPFNKQKRQDCVAAANAANNGDKNQKQGVIAGKRLLIAEADDLFRTLDHKLTWKQTKCYSLYFWSKTKRQACLDKAKRNLMAAFAALGSPEHKGFWGNFKCLLKHAFNKTKRQECYDAVKAEDAKKDSANAKHRLTAQHKHILDTTGCFFKNMFNKQKRAECNAKAKAARDAKNKAAAEKKAAEKKAEEDRKAEEKRKENRVGLDSKGKKKVHRHFYF